jgi:hypothetical protein
MTAKKSALTMAPSLTAAAPNSGSARQSQQWGLTKTLIVVIGTCCTVSAAVNILHAHSANTTTTALHQAMKAFTQEPPSYKAAMNTPQQATMLHSEQAADGEEEPHERGHHHIEDEEHEPDPETSSNEMPYLSHLSCQAHGGPHDTFAQEMIYWQDIKSDTKYVSPFRAKHGQQRRYMVRCEAMNDTPHTTASL